MSPYYGHGFGHGDLLLLMKTRSLFLLSCLAWAVVVLHTLPAPAQNSPAPDPALPTVSLYAEPWITSEPCPTCRVIPGALHLLRTGSTAEALTVFLVTDGTATPGDDYQPLPARVEIPVGLASVEVKVMAVDDTLVEGPEVVRTRIVLPPDPRLPGYTVADDGAAMVVIRDDDNGAPDARLDIVTPKESARFPLGAVIELSAIAVWTEGEVDQPVEFFADGSFIGQSSPLMVDRRPIPDLPSLHTIYWTNPPAGLHVLTARAPLSLNASVSAPPVQIAVDAEPPVTVVSIEATDVIAEETSWPLRRLPLRGLFTISRKGPVATPLPVYVQYSGTATSGEDYPMLPWLLTIPAGAAEVQLRIEPTIDTVPEPIETLVATISNCPPPTDPPMGPPCYNFEINPAHQQATVFLRDDGITEATLHISRPPDGAEFKHGDPIPIEATAIDLQGYISRVEFWDGDKQIGVSEIYFFRAPDPGTPIQHGFAWGEAAAGRHLLTARAASTSGLAITSNPVRVAVVGDGEPNLPPRVAIVRPQNGAEVPPETAVEIVAETADPDGFVRRVEFYVDGRKIGERSVDLTRASVLGEARRVSFVWAHPVPGPHVLGARATDNVGASAWSAPVAIKVAAAEPLPVVTVVTRDAWAVEPQPNTALNTATFAIRRYGPTNDALTVDYSLHGTAENGVDYEKLSGAAVIPAGRRAVAVTVRALADELAEACETVVLRLEEPPLGAPVEAAYRVGWPRQAVAMISDQPWVQPSGGARCAVLRDGWLSLCFAAETGGYFRVEASPDLQNWETIFDGLGLDGAVHFIQDDTRLYPRRFYRLLPEPAGAMAE